MLLLPLRIFRRQLRSEQWIHHDERRGFRRPHRGSHDSGWRHTLRARQRTHIHVARGRDGVSGADRYYALLHEHWRTREYAMGKDKELPDSMGLLHKENATP